MTKARTLADNFAADINAVTADAPLTGGGTSGTVTVGIQAGTTAQSGAVQLTDSTASTSTTTAATPNSVKSAYDLANGAIAKSLVDAKGDLLVGSADNTVSRLAVASTAGYLLTVDSAEATGLKWAAPASGGGMTLLSTTSLAGVSTVTISSISQAYNHLEILVEDFDFNANDKGIGFRINGDTGSNYFSNSAQIVNENSGFNTFWDFTSFSSTNEGGVIYTKLPFYSVTTTQKTMLGQVTALSSTGAGYYRLGGCHFSYKGTPAAISSVTVFNRTDSTNFDAGSVKIYGVK